LIEEMRDGVSTQGAAGEGVGKGRLQVGGAIAIEEAEQRVGVGGYREVAPGQFLEEGGRVGARLAETISAAQVMGLPLGGRELRQMVLHLEDLPAIPGAGVAREFGGAVEDADERVTDNERQGATDKAIRDGVVVAIEADVGRFAGDDGAEEVAGEGMVGHGQQAGALLLQGAGDGPLIGIPRPRAGVGSLGDPGRELRVEIVEGGEAASSEERVAEVANGPFHTSFLIPARHRAGLGGEVVVAGEFQQARVKADVVADAIEDDALEIVVQERLRISNYRIRFSVQSDAYILWRAAHGRRGAKGQRKHDL
jgi:hypothetical protein